MFESTLLTIFESLGVLERGAVFGKEFLISVVWRYSGNLKQQLTGSKAVESVMCLGRLISACKSGLLHFQKYCELVRTMICVCVCLYECVENIYIYMYNRCIIYSLSVLCVHIYI